MNLVLNVFILITLAFKFTENANIIMLILGGGFSSLIYYLGTAIIIYDLGKIMLLR